MDIEIFYKVILFWVIFFITPGPVWIAVMEATRKLRFVHTVRFFLQVFLPVNSSVQFLQALLCVIFVELVSKVFSDIAMLFYILGGVYIVYLAYKTLRSKKNDTILEITYANLAMVMLLSPKIWLLFPSGAVIANQLNQGLIINAFIFALAMLIISSFMFVFYTSIGKIGTKLLGNNFSYLAFGLLILFALFLFNEALQLTINA